MGFREQGENGIYLGITLGAKAKFEGNRGTKAILGNRGNMKSNLRSFGNMVTSQFISKEQRNRYPPCDQNPKVLVLIFLVRTSGTL